MLVLPITVSRLPHHSQFTLTLTLTPPFTITLTLTYPPPHPYRTTPTAPLTVHRRVSLLRYGQQGVSARGGGSECGRGGDVLFVAGRERGRREGDRDNEGDGERDKDKGSYDARQGSAPELRARNGLAHEKSFSFAQPVCVFPLQQNQQNQHDDSADSDESLRGVVR